MADSMQLTRLSWNNRKTSENKPTDLDSDYEMCVTTVKLWASLRLLEESLFFHR
jgi:hypothetical protein